jgi:hypothetical protein
VQTYQTWIGLINIGILRGGTAFTYHNIVENKLYLCL